MITGNTVKRLNSGTTPSQPTAQQEGKKTISRPVKNTNPDVTANYEPEQKRLSGTVNRPPNTGPVEDRPPQQKSEHPHWPIISQ